MRQFFSVFKVFIAIVLTMGMMGCSSSNKLPLDASTYKENPLDLEPYQIQIGDSLDIKFLVNPELNEQVTVRPDGRISTIIASDVIAYGRSPEGLRSELIDIYAAHLKNPQLSVIVRSFAPTRVFVLGEVGRTGEFVSVTPDMTILKAISRAGGLSNSADRDGIIVIRRIPGEEAQVFNVDFDEAAKGRDIKHDITLASSDVVFVPRTGIADAYVYYEQYVKQFISSSFIGYTIQVD